MKDFVFTDLNLMKRIKKENVKNDAARYLGRNNPTGRDGLLSDGLFSDGLLSKVGTLLLPVNKPF